MKRRFFRRPSASMIVALIALFVSLGGVGYAAVGLGPGSVGTAQLRNGAVTNRKLANGSVGNRKLQAGAVGPRKIIPGAVGLAQINANAVQARIGGSCPATTAINSVDATGAVGCASTLPAEQAAAPAAPVALTTGAASQVASATLPAGSGFFIFADPQVSLTGGTAGQGVDVSCTIAASSTKTTRTRDYQVEIGTSGQPLSGSVPLVLAAPAGNNLTVTVRCSESLVNPQNAPAPTVAVTSGVDAIQVQSVS